MEIRGRLRTSFLPAPGFSVKVRLILFFLGLFGFALADQKALGNVLTSPALPLSHCYHWLDASAGYLEFKYQYAQKNQNELTFFTTPGTSKGAVAGAGLYCAKSPSQSHSYGDRVIRIDFVSDVVVLDTRNKKNVCGHRGNAFSTEACQKKNWDVKYYQRDPDWFVIQNPGAIARWSATSDQLVQDLHAELAHGGSSFKSKVEKVLAEMKSEIAQSGVRELKNERARIELADVLNQDAQRILSVPVLTVISALQSIAAGKVRPEVMAWAWKVSVMRALKDPEIPWSELSESFVRNPIFQENFVTVLTDYFQSETEGSGRLKNVEVLLTATNIVAEKFESRFLERIVKTYLKNPPLLGNAMAMKMSPPLIDAFRQQLPLWLEKSFPRLSQTERMSVLRSLVGWGIEDAFKDQLRRRILADLPTTEQSQLFLSAGGKSFPLGSEGKDYLGLCQAQIFFHDLYGKELKLVSLKGRTYLEIDEVSKDANLAQFCDQSSAIANQIFALKGKDEKEIFVVSGKIEMVPFYFIVSDEATLRSATMDFLRRNPTLVKINDLSASVNDESRRFAHPPSGYWSHEGAVQALLKIARGSGVYSKELSDYEKQAKVRAKKFRITGTLGYSADRRPPIVFSVDNLDELQKDCLQMGSHYDMNELGKLNLQVNETEISTYNPRGAWKGVSEICGAMRTALASYIPTARADAVFKRRADAKYFSEVVVKADYSTIRIPVAVDLLEAVGPQCLELVGEWDVHETRRVQVQRPGGEEKISYPQSSFFKSPEEVCAVVVFQLDGFIPSQMQQNLLARQALFRFVLKFKDDKVRTLVVDSRDEIVPQCRALVNEDFAKKQSTIYIQGPGSFDEKIWPKNSYWKDATELCEAIEGKMDDVIPSQARQRVLQLQGRYRFDVSSNGRIPRTFVVDSKEEIVPQCQLLIREKDIREKSRISVVLGPEKTVSSNSKSTYYKDLAEVCRAIEIAVDPLVPSREQQRILGLQGKLRLVTEGRGAVARNFVLDSKDQFLGQCRALIPDEDARTNTSISLSDGKVSRTTSSRGSSWANAQELCEALRKAMDRL